MPRGSELTLEDAQHVFDFMGLQDVKLPWQVRHVEGVRSGIQAQGPRSLSRACVKINPRRKQIQFRADAQRRVVDIQLAKPRNVVHGRVDYVQELVEITGSADSLRTFRENRIRCLKRGPCQAALVRVALSMAEFSGKGNIAQFFAAASRAWSGLEFAGSTPHPWYYPSVAAYAGLLEQR